MARVTVQLVEREVPTMDLTVQDVDLGALILPTTCHEVDMAFEIVARNPATFHRVDRVCVTSDLTFQLVEREAGTVLRTVHVELSAFEMRPTTCQLVD